jgi:hypothetical protein
MFRPTPGHYQVWTYEQCQRRRFFTVCYGRPSTGSLCVEYNTKICPVGLVVVGGDYTNGGVSVGLL